MQSSTLIFYGVAVVVLGTVQSRPTTRDSLRVRLIEALLKRFFVDAVDHGTQYLDIDISGVNEGLVLYKCFGTSSADTIMSKYNELDVDNDGVVDLNEFVAGINKYSCAANGNELFDIYDEDDSEFLDPEEFRVALRQPMSDVKKKLVMQKFLLADKNDDGVFTADDNILKTTQTALNLVVWMDANRDGKVTLQEFVDYWSRKLGLVEDDNSFLIKLHNAFSI